MAVRTFTAKGVRRYAVEFEIRGHRIFRRLPAGASKEQAAQLETRLKHEFIDQAVIGKKPNVTLRFAIESWLLEVVKGRKSEVQTANHACAVIGVIQGALLSDVARCAEHVRSGKHPVRDDFGRGFAKDEGGGKGQRGGAPAPRVSEHDGEVRALSPSTINRRLCILKAVAKFAWRKGWTDENLSGKIQLLPEPKYQRREVTFADAKALIQAASTPRAKALIALSAYTGMRLGEVLKLQPKDVRDGVIVVRDAKNGTDRTIPILPELKPHLSQLPFDAGWRNVYRGFEAARRRTGLKIRYHDLRHMMASALARSGVDLRLSMDIMGHKSVETHRRYVHTDLAEKRKAMRRAIPIKIPSDRRTKAKKAA